MRRTWAGLLALTLLAPVLRADDKAKADVDKAYAAKTPAEQYKQLTGQFDKEFGQLVAAFEAAKDNKGREEVQQKASKLPQAYAVKMMLLAEQHPNDAVAAEALLWVAGEAGSRGLPSPPQAKEAIDRLLRNFDNEKLGPLAMNLIGTEDGEPLIRAIREKTKNPAVKLVAMFALARTMRESDDQSAARSNEVESLLVEITGKLRDVKGLPPEFKDDVERVLQEVRTLSVGKAAPAAESTDLNGKAAKLSDHKGKVVVLDFWATWCGPCKGMIPHERELVKRHAGKPFVFISVSADQKKDDLQKFLETEKMPWIHWWSEAKGSVIEKWFVRGFPTFYIIDAKGVIRGRIVGGGEDNEKRIDALVDKLVKEAETKSE